MTTSRFVRVIYSSHFVYNRVGIVSLKYPQYSVFYVAIQNCGKGMVLGLEIVEG